MTAWKDDTDGYKIQEQGEAEVAAENPPMSCGSLRIHKQHIWIGPITGIHRCCQGIKGKGHSNEHAS